MNSRLIMYNVGNYLSSLRHVLAFLWSLLSDFKIINDWSCRSSLAYF